MMLHRRAAAAPWLGAAAIKRGAPALPATLGRQRRMPHTRGPEPPRPTTGGSQEAPSGLAAGELYLATEWTKIPHPDKVETGGEDALFATPQAVGIADGVGGWAKQGIDAGEVSRALMASADALAAASPGEVDALSLLRNAWQRVEATQVVGSTTAVLASLVGGRLHTANLGDSGFVFYRDGAAFHRSDPLVHEFNLPLQLGTGSRDAPGNSEIWEVDVMEGDVLLLSTDGLFDNLFPHEVDSIVSRSGRQAAVYVSEELAMATLERSLDSRAECPFVDEARAVGYVDEIGGKPDDITVLVAAVRRA